MFAGIKRIVGAVTVHVKKGVVTVEGVPTHVISTDIRKVWGTSRIEQNLFTDISDSSFSFYEFFAMEVHYILSKLIDDRKSKANRRTLAKILAELKEKTWLADLDKQFPHKLNFDQDGKFTMTPLASQEGFFKAYDQVTQQRKLNGMLLAGAAGSGKTFMSIYLTEMLESDLTIVLCPKNALDRVWKQNFIDDYVKGKTPTYWVCNAGIPRTGKERYIVCNYEYLAELIRMVPVLKYSKLTILLDESHNFNEIKSMRTELFVQLCEMTKCENVIWLSGTPIKALAVEAIPLLRCIDKMFTADVEAAFKKIFGVSSERATDILNNRLEGLLYKIEKKELDILPPVFREIKVVIPKSEKFTLKQVRVAMQKFTEERTVYYEGRKRADEKTFYDCLDLYARGLPRAKRDELTYYYKCLDIVIRAGGDARFCKDEMVFCNRFEKKEILPVLPKDLKDKFKEAKTIVKYVKLKIQGECLGRVVGRLRIDAHIEMADHLDYVSVVESTEKKTVVFTSFTEVIDKLITYLPSIGLEPEFVYAKTNSQLTPILTRFEKDPDVNPLVATYASLSTAVPLIMADVCVLLDAPWRDYQLQQTVSRISRLGATTQTYVYTAVLDTGDEPNISTRSFDVLKWSQQQVEQIVGIKSPFEITDDLEQADLALESLTESAVYVDPFEGALKRFEDALEAYGCDAPTEVKVSPSFMNW